MVNSKQLRQIPSIVNAEAHYETDRVNDDVICRYEKKTVTVENLTYAVDPKPYTINSSNNNEIESIDNGFSKLKYLYKEYRLLIYLVSFIGLAFLLKDVFIQFILLLSVLGFIFLVIYKMTIYFFNILIFLFKAYIAISAFVSVLSFFGWILSLFI